MDKNMLGCYANTWIRQKVFTRKGEKIGGHKHKYDHLSILASGRVLVEVDGTSKEFIGPTFIVIPKDKIHDVTSLTDNVVWYCVFAHRDIDGNVFDPELNSVTEPAPCYAFPASSITIDSTKITE